MKAEINNENKAKFFALYWGQEVMCFNDEGQYKKGDCYEVQGDLDDHNFLELKPLSQISDEDKEYAYWPVYPTHVSVMNIDYLRSRGYALPWMGLSVEEMVEAGWIKLK